MSPDHFTEALLQRDDIEGALQPHCCRDVVEGTVLGIEKSKVYLDIPPFGTGIIYGREYINARDIIKKINVGDTVAGKVVSISNKDGYIEISLKEPDFAQVDGEGYATEEAKLVFTVNPLSLKVLVPKKKLA